MAKNVPKPQPIRAEPGKAIRLSRNTYLMAFEILDPPEPIRRPKPPPKR